MHCEDVIERIGWPVPPDVLRQLIDYDPQTGAMTWRKRGPEFFKSDGYRSAEGCAANWNSRNAGKPALAAKSHGYLCGRLFDRTVKAHRVAWAIARGEWPKHIDHINGDKADNRLCNLRSVTVAENNKNLSMRCDNTSGTVGVRYDAARKLWKAEIANKFIGRFETMEAAKAARMAEEEKLGFHQNHGRIVSCNQ